MKVNIAKPKRATKIDDGFMTEAISTYIRKSRFPKRTELHKFMASGAYYKEKLKQHSRVLKEATDDIHMVQEKTMKLKNACIMRLNKLRGEV